jgi:signal transduction histidine kinase
LKDIKSLTALTTDLLSLTRLQQSSPRTSSEKLNLGILISESLAKIDPMVKEKKMDVKIMGSRRDVVCGNREDLVKLFTILLDNAVKYTPEKGRIFIEHKTRGKNAFISVKDTGMGISGKDPFIFEDLESTCPDLKFTIRPLACSLIAKSITTCTKERCG